MVTRYTVDASRSAVVVRARSTIHDTTTRWNRVSGQVTADPDQLAGGATEARLTVDMTAFDAGDWLRNRKLRKDMDVERHPTATFELAGLRDVVRHDDGSFTATASGSLRWRDREVPVTASGRGTVEPGGIDATASFELDVRDLGVEPPRFLMLKVEAVVAVEVTLRATAT